MKNLAPSLIPGTLNVRDVGGRWGKIRPGQLFRGDDLSRIPEAGREAVASLGIERVIDLRTEAEQSARPSRLDGVEIVPIPMLDGHFSVPEVMKKIANRHEVPFDPVEEMCSMYRALVADYQPQFRQVFERLSEGKVTLFHCTGGKDRTGVVGWLVQQLMGVSETQAMQDYLESSIRRGARIQQIVERLEGQGFPGPYVEPLLGVSESFLRATGPEVLQTPRQWLLSIDVSEEHLQGVESWLRAPRR